jgi:hypothetical protein
MSKKNTIEEIAKLFNEEEAVLTPGSAYIARRATTLNYICKYGKTHTTSLANWQKGTRCLCVVKNNRNISFYRDAEELLNKYNAKLITTFEEYLNVTTPLLFLNCKAEEQTISLNNLNVCDRFFNQKEEITALVLQDLKQAAIADKFNTTQHIISMCLRLWGVNNPDGNRFIEIDIPKEILYKLYWEEKQHPKVIADKYSCSITTVVKNMQKYGIPLRTKSESRLGDLNPIYNVGHTNEAKQKMSSAFLNGRKRGYSGNWGKVSKYNTPNQGVVTMRSSWEVRLADYLSTSYEYWLYEPEVFKLTDLISYKPDFYLPNRNIYIEVKGRTLEEDLHKVNKFRSLGFSVLILTRTILEEIGLINSSGKIIYTKEALTVDSLIERYL